MEDSSRLSNNTENFGFTGRQHQPLDPPKNSENTISPPMNMHHHSASVDDLFTVLEQPAWLDELLSEPASPKMNKGHHRRSASDTAAYLSLPYKEDDLRRSHHHVPGPSWRFQNSYHNYDDLWQSNSYERVHNKSGWDLSTVNGTTNLQTHMSCRAVNRQGPSASKEVSKTKEGTPTKPDGPGSKMDSKRIKHQNAHRARLRRLEYISDLERTIQVLQVEGCEMSSAIHYLDQQLIMLSMENRALKQRLDSLAEIQKLKHVEQQLLEREIGSLQLRRHHQQPQQKQNQVQVQPVQQNRHNKYQPPVTQEPESQFAALAI